MKTLVNSIGALTIAICCILAPIQFGWELHKDDEEKTLSDKVFEFFSGLITIIEFFVLFFNIAE